MRRTTLAYFLMLLLAIAALDDACAAATPDPSDDVAAAENDEYLPRASLPTGESDLSLPPLLNAVDGVLCVAPARDALATSPPGPLAGPPRLYLFMSLRC
jgi:hypothetical protein